MDLLGFLINVSFFKICVDIEEIEGLLLDIHLPIHTIKITDGILQTVQFLFRQAGQRNA